MFEYLTQDGQLRAVVSADGLVRLIHVPTGTYTFRDADHLYRDLRGEWVPRDGEFAALLTADLERNTDDWVRCCFSWEHVGSSGRRVEFAEEEQAA